jgi:hypothetical protein
MIGPRVTTHCSVRRLAHGALLCALALLVGAVRATEEDARTFFAEGRRWRAEGNCREAIVHFERALAAWPEGLGALRNVAECQQELGLLASARRSYWELRKRVLKMGDPKYAGWDGEAEAAYAALGPRVARLTVVVQGRREGVRVAVDGQTLVPELFGVELERDPGEHAIEAFYGGPTTVLRKVALGEGARETVVLEVPAAPAPTPKEPRRDEAPRPDADAGEGLRTGAIVAFAVGGLAIVGTGAAIGVRQAAIGRIEDGCRKDGDGFRCADASLESDASRGKTASVLVNVFGAAAVAGVGTGIALLIAAGSAAEPPAPGAPAQPEPKSALRLAPTPSGVALAWEVGFP